MLSEIKPRVEPLLATLSKPLSGVNPNIITLLGLIPVSLFYVFTVKGLFLSALICLVLSLLDMLDGVLARKFNKVTQFGGLLDSTLDRLADAVYFLAFVSAGIVRIELGIALIVVSYLISYIRSRAELAAKGEIKLAVGIIERGERIIFIAAALIMYAVRPQASFSGFNIAELVLTILLALSVITVIQRFWKAYQLLD